MGIQLPPELADVAARAGVEWPEADEDKLRKSAAAWRDAGSKLTNLSRDADHAARTALSATQGPAADAARRHWSTFVHPDTGHLTATARGCTAAADRLEHAANQVGAAKVEIVRNLVDLARSTDAAHTAAGAGHPHALLGLDTAVRGTRANVTNITNNLVSSVQPGSDVDVAGVRDVTGPHSGHPHGGGLLPDPVRGVLDPVVNTVSDAAHRSWAGRDTAVASPGTVARAWSPVWWTRFPVWRNRSWAGRGTAVARCPVWWTRSPVRPGMLVRV